MVPTPPGCASQRLAAAPGALCQDLEFEVRELVLDNVGAAFALLGGGRSAAPLDQRDAEVKRDAVDQTDATRLAWSAFVELYGRVVLSTRGRQVGVHGDVLTRQDWVRRVARA